mmetsp:Transcript_88873/g.256282  ORF Transcript_88873/g.256282 Transcript_88873/m.256282 type:complete len:304 (-) Transcript_88873:547-1458(-)
MPVHVQERLHLLVSAPPALPVRAAQELQAAPAADGEVDSLVHCDPVVATLPAACGADLRSRREPVEHGEGRPWDGAAADARLQPPHEAPNTVPGLAEGLRLPQERRLEAPRVVGRRHGVDLVHEAEAQGLHDVRHELRPIIALQDVDDADVIEHALRGLVADQGVLEGRLVAAQHREVRVEAGHEGELLRRRVRALAAVVHAEADGVIHDVVVAQKASVLAQGVQQLVFLAEVRDADDLVGEVEVLQHHTGPGADPPVLGGSLQVVDDMRLQMRGTVQNVVHHHELHPVAVEADLEGAVEPRK